MPKLELSAKEKVALAGLAVLGRDYMAEAYELCHKTTSTNKASLDVMRSKWVNSKWAKEFMDNVKQQYADNLLANINEETELSDKQLVAIIQRGIVSEKDLKKQSDMSLKLMQWRKDAKIETETEKDAKRLFLPWVSVCRLCPLMNSLKKKSDEQKGKAIEYDNTSVSYPVYLVEKLRARQTAARERIKGNKELATNMQLMKEAEAIAATFAECLSYEDVCDIYDYFRRSRLAESSEKPHWIK